MMDPLWSGTSWRTFKYFIILIVSTYYILCISWIIERLVLLNVFKTPPPPPQGSTLNQINLFTPSHNTSIRIIFSSVSWFRIVLIPPRAYFFQFFRLNCCMNFSSFHYFYIPSPNFPSLIHHHNVMSLWRLQIMKPYIMLFFPASSFTLLFFSAT